MADLTARLQTAVGSAYRLERELGGGGMSRVFLADEPALGRRVVIKVLPPEMAAGVNQDRFRREIQLAARLQHPHIVQLLAAGSEGDLLWYVMPYIEGESLRVKLARESELPVKEVLRILREVTDALSYAHEQGVVHRDIKPDNILLAGKHALVTDFGVAKAVTESSAGALTSLGMALGTPAYMAPEQASGDPHVDHRADLYALGAMAYEMLAGRPPFTGGNPQAVLAAHVTQAAAPVSSVRAAVPAALNAIVMRCLEKRAADRWQTAEELAPHLEALLTPSGGTTPTLATPVVSSATEAALRRAHPLRVAALFVVGSLVVLAASWWVVQRLGLPTWVWFAAIGLLVAGLPVVLLAGRHERQRALARTTGLMAAAPSGVLGRFTTFRGAVIGGVLAFAGLAVGAGGFMALRAAGVGPFATLVSAGVLKERGGLVLADFLNRTIDSTLGESVTQALRIDLTRSTVVRLLEAQDLAAGLRRMQRDPGTPLTEDLAREIAQREGAAAVVVGEISPLGAGFVLAARVIAAGDGATLLAERETAADAGQLIDAVDRLSRKLREGIGESLRSIRAGEQLELVTTSSLEALRKYSQAQRAADAARNEDAVALLEEALRFDSTFAMAWRKLAVVLSNAQIDPTREINAATRAYELRDRLPERERLVTTAFYYSNVELDHDKTISAYEQVLERWPDDIPALNNIALEYFTKRRFQDAERVTRHGVTVSPNTAVLWANLLRAQGLQGHFDAADSTLERWAAAAPEARIRFISGFQLALARGDYARAWQYADSSGRLEQANLQAASRAQKSFLFTLGGRLAEAGRLRREATEINVRRGARADAYFGTAGTSGAAGQDLWFRGRADRAIQRMDSVLRKHPLDSLPPASRPYLMLAQFYAQAGDVARAERFVQDYEREVPEVLRTGDSDRFLAQGMIALAGDRAADALTAFRTYRDREGCTLCYLFEMGRAFDALEQPDSALAMFEAIATLPDMGPAGRPATLPLSYHRLGELFEAKGDREKAIEYYGKFADLWKDADPDLQPRVEEVRKRIAELAARER
jgi:tetratricopeptide (TPR) repeat protein